MATAMEFYISGNDADGVNIDNVASTGLGQTFTIGTTGANVTFALTSVDLRIQFTWVDTTVDLVTEIYEVDPAGIPTGAALSSNTTATTYGASFGPAWVNVPMDTTTLKANTQYAVVITSVAANATNYFEWPQDTGGGYAGGSGLVKNGTWASTAPIDLLFQINGGDYGGTLCTLADAVNKAGANASSNATVEPLVSDFVKQAESFINSATRKNWTDVYSTLNDDVKYLLNQIISSLAAIDIITYDMSGYTSRVEAESMINIYREEVNRALFFLLVEDVKDFIIAT